ncbi:MAG: hypothetical protein ACOVQ2_02445 [Flavobacterium sp.]
MKLEQYKKKPGFKTPNNFFESFEEKLFLNLSNEKPVIKISFWKKNQKWMLSTAAMFVFSAVFVINYLSSNPKIDTETIAFEDVLQLTDWENELNDKEISELQNDILINENTINEELINLDYTELN